MKKTSVDPKCLQSAATALRILAHADRLRIIDLLKNRRCSVAQITAGLGLPQAVVSKHLARLKSAGILKSESCCNFRFYSLAKPKILEVIQCIKKSCSAGKP